MGSREKEYHPVPAVVGTPGQGKTEVLHWITGQCRDIVDGPTIIREEFAAKLKAMDPDPICLFATFNSTSMLDESELGDVEAALTSRVAARYTTERSWNATWN